ncbi:hypothetical protein SAMN05444158_6143 [Bradyrhizobium canariense]|uniref:Uncharacterized protein n=1 Tax=Bradyrhizobium canariense TaxID=255045 RepID=A0A1H2AH60_9BRAD|nr:hypothetical protein SAMN05444158_6143 [Bradyrhizobium canariense]
MWGEKMCKGMQPWGGRNGFPGFYAGNRKPSSPFGL